MTNALLAEIVLALHLLYVGFVIFGYLAVMAGGALSWGWVRGRVFRLAHLAAIAFVAFEATVGMVCPLTWIEYMLRGSGEGESLMGRIMRSLLYYDLPLWVFTAGYLALAAFAVLLLWWVPLHPRGKDSR